MMKGLNLKDIARQCGGVLVIPDGDDSKAAAEITAVETDSRKVTKGSLFAAIKGERVDGHSFIGKAFDFPVKVWQCAFECLRQEVRQAVMQVHGFYARLISGLSQELG